MTKINENDYSNIGLVLIELLKKLKQNSKKDMIALFNESKYYIDYIESPFKNYKSKSIKKNINKITFGLFEEFLTTQYFIRAINE